MSERSVGLDVVRAICVAGVVITHFSSFFLPAFGPGLVARQALSIGSFGVSGFFLLSAYLLTSILLKEVGSGQGQVWKRYWIRRSLRIWPLYFLVLIAVVIFGIVTSTRIGGLPWLATFTYNWVSWFEPNNYLSHFWSMGAEEQLYILVPILSFVAFRWRWPVLIVLMAIGPISRLIVAASLPYPAVWNFTTSHLDVFALGVLLASLDYERPARWQRVRAVIADSLWSRAVAGALAAALVVLSAIDPQLVFGSRASAVTYLAADLVWACLLITVTQRSMAGSSLVTRGAVWMGRRSYGIYVYHWPAVVFGSWLASVIAIPLPVVGLVLLAAVLVFSEISFRWIESPFLRLKSRFSRETASVN